ncbi:MAG: ABC transporter substrate binding protein [Planctomycetota bacterium]
MTMFLQLASAMLPALLAQPLPQSPPDRGEVVIALGGDAQPFRDAAQAATRRLVAEGFRTRHLSEAAARQWRPADGDRPRAVVAIGTQAAVGLKSRLGDLALVYCMVADPKAAGLEGSEHIAGVTTAVPLGPQLELIRETLPACRSVGMLYRSGATGGVDPEQVRAALPEQLSLQAVDISKCTSVAAAIDQLLALDVDVVWTAPDNTVFDAATVQTLLLRSLQAGVPVFGFSASCVRAGAVFGVSVDPADQGTQCAELLSSVLDPQQPKAMPSAPVAPTFVACVNPKVAEHLKVTLPPSVRARAQEVVKSR